MLRELKHYERAARAFREHMDIAAAALAAAVGRHGLDGVQVYPAARLAPAELKIARRLLLGVRLQQAALAGEPGQAPEASNPSPEAEHCRALFVELLRRSAGLAALSGNLERLRSEYRRTERRARALEDVLLPEIDQTLSDLETRLEELEQEEVIRVRRA